MSVQKERKLKRLKKQRIWPYVFGLFMVIIVFAVLAVLVISLRFVGLAYDKIQQGHDNSRSVAQMVEENWDEQNPDSLTDICNSNLKILPYVQDVCIVNSKNEIICQYGENVPLWEFFISEFSAKGEDLILDNNEDGIYYIEDGQFRFQLENAVDVILNRLEDSDEEVTGDVLWEGEKFTTISFWYKLSLTDSDYYVCVKNSIPIRMAELFLMAAVVDVILALELILIVYYLISIFTLLWGRRKLAVILDTDIVTGGYNLQFFYKKAKSRLKRKHRNNYAVVTIRMNKYQNFCACYGVKEGEELLEVFHQVLCRGISKKEVLAHGEKAEFALLLSYTTEEALTNRLHGMISDMENVKAKQKKYFSIGICRAERKGQSVEAMYNCAGIARSKIAEDSTERIIWFNEEMKQEQLWISKVESEMEAALENREFQVYLQPKYSTKDEVLSGAEALVRWIHPKEGLVAPYRFIPIFESNGFIMQLDDYMLTEVARQQAKWMKDGKKVVPVSVNVSRAHFIREDLAEHICRLVDQFAVPHEVIELELTESAFFDDKNVLLNTIKKLKNYGFAISMDDFGAGYSSLNSLKELPLDVVKLDAEFFRKEDEEGRGKLIVGDTISLAKKLNMKIVAEGIETREQVDFLADLQCDLIQGYYFAKPMPVAEFEERMSTL